MKQERPNWLIVNALLLSSNCIERMDEDKFNKGGKKRDGGGTIYKENLKI